MKFIFGLIILFGCQYTGSYIRNILNIPIPGNVIGMIILFSLLYSGILKEKHIKDVSDFLLKNLSLFFIPASVGLIMYVNIFKEHGAKIFFLTILSYILVLVITGLVVEFLAEREDKIDGTFN
ncbi:MAG: holin-like protein [Thermosediminibacterales bacterium]|nr:holin-like protein [Thermosediminibacterales bacterium]